jgi:uncharacterized membrane protein
MQFLDLLLWPLTFAAALGCALMGGLFFAFSNFVMQALARLPAPAGIAAMQAINVTVLNPLFLALFVGTAAACALLAVAALLRWPQAGALWLLAGALLYLFGNFAVTLVFNVPRNEALARLDAAQAGAERVWSDFVTGWTRWNHVRTVAGLAAAASLAVALGHLPQP